MQCTSPVNLDGALFPCGNCISCRISRTREWAVRIMHEASYHENSVFITLTYDDKHLPDDVGLHKRDLQLFFKRFRKELEPRKIKYYACGEYGEQTQRPHYHAIIFGVGILDKIFKYLRTVGGKDYYTTDSWTLGYIFLGSVTYKSARYVAGYIQKKYNGKLAEEVYGGKQPPFQTQSNGIGKDYVRRHHDRLIDNNYITVDGIKNRVPRYYKRLLGDDLTEERKDINVLLSIVKEEEFEKSIGLEHLSSEAKKHAKDVRDLKKLELEQRIARWKKRS